MFTVKIISENREDVIRRLAKKHYDAEVKIEELLRHDDMRRFYQQREEENRSTLKTLSEELRRVMQSGRTDESETIREEIVRVKDKIEQSEKIRSASENTIREILEHIPNLPHESVPEGRGAEDNVVERQGGTIPELDPATALPHWELASKYDLIDFELGVKITGAGFPVYKGRGSRLQRALINFFIDCAVEA